MKSLAIALLTLTAALSGTAFAGNSGSTQDLDSLLCWLVPWLCESPPPHQSGGGGVTAAPEIDPASAAAGLTLLAGGLAALRGRHSKRKDS